MQRTIEWAHNENYYDKFLPTTENMLVSILRSRKKMCSTFALIEAAAAKADTYPTLTETVDCFTALVKPQLPDTFMVSPNLVQKTICGGEILHLGYKCSNYLVLHNRLLEDVRTDTKKTEGFHFFSSIAVTTATYFQRLLIRLSISGREVDALFIPMASNTINSHNMKVATRNISSSIIVVVGVIKSSRNTRFGK